MHRNFGLCLFNVCLVFFILLICGCSKDRSIYDEEPEIPEEPIQFVENDYDIVVNGVAYNVIDVNKLTAEVVAKTTPNSYSGEITIAPVVNINGKPCTVVRIGRKAFKKSNVTKINIPSSVAFIDDEAFSWSQLEELTLQSSIEVMCAQCFAHCTKLKEVIIEDSPKSIILSVSGPKDGFSYIGGGMFEIFQGSAIEKIYIGRSTNIECISHYLDYNYYGLGIGREIQEIVFGIDVSSVDLFNKYYYPDVFECGELKKLIQITCMGTTPPNISTKGHNDNFMKTKVYVPKGALNNYKENVFWGSFWNIEEVEFN